MYEGNTKRPMETILFLSLFLFLVLKMSNTKAAQLVTQLGGKEKILAECHIPFGHPRWNHLGAAYRTFSAAGGEQLSLWNPPWSRNLVIS